MAVAFDANLGTFSQNTAGATIALTTSAVAASSSYVFVAAFHNGTGTAASCAGGSLTWSKVAQSQRGTSYVTWFAAPAPAGLASSTVLTVTFNAVVSSQGLICASSFTGLPPQPSYVSTFNNQNGAAAWTGTIPAPLTDGLVLSASFIDTSTVPASAPSSGTEIHDFWQTGLVVAMVTHYTLQPLPGSVTMSGTWSGLTGASANSTCVLNFGTGAGVRPFNPVPFTRGAGGG